MRAPRETVGEAGEAMMITFETVYDGDASTLRCRECGEEFHYGPAYNNALVFADAWEHHISHHPTDAPQPR